MPAEVGQFGINFRIKPIGFENRRFKLSRLSRSGTPPKARKPFSRQRRNVSVS